MNRAAINEIDRVIKDVWMHEIKWDYEKNYLLQEDTLKNAFYFHLRTRLDSVLKDHHLRIFTELRDGPLKECNKVIDLAIVRVDDNGDECYLGDEILEIAAIMEIKFQGNTYSARNNIWNDFSKLKYYAEELKINCQYYMVSLYEAVDEQVSWLTETQIKDWAEGRLTELNASYDKKENMIFYICAHNHLNPWMPNFI